MIISRLFHRNVSALQLLLAAQRLAGGEVPLPIIMQEIFALHDVEHVSMNAVLTGSVAGYKPVQSYTQRINVTFILTTLQHLQGHIAISVAAHAE